MTIIGILKKWYPSHKFSEDLRYEIIFFKLKQNGHTNNIKVAVNKMKTKTLFVPFKKLTHF